MPCKQFTSDTYNKNNQFLGVVVFTLNWVQKCRGKSVMAHHWLKKANYQINFSCKARAIKNAFRQYILLLCMFYCSRNIRKTIFVIYTYIRQTTSNCHFFRNSSYNAVWQSTFLIAENDGGLHFCPTSTNLIAVGLGVYI